jgi:hypothetical protein
MWCPRSQDAQEEKVKAETIVAWALVAFTATLQLMAQQGEGPILHPKTTLTKPVGNPQAVCKFISEHMQSKLPQSPTLCSATQETPGDYEINVFSPKDVLEGDMRRAWSSALFQTLEALVEEKSLKGTCSLAEPVCFVSVSDSHLTSEGIRYRLILSQKDLDALRTLVMALHGTEFSDQWYFAWWSDLMISKESEHPGSKGNAELIARGACEDYVQANAITASLRNKKPPSCSVLLATDKSVYIEVDTSYRTKWAVDGDFHDDVGALLSNVYADLPKTIGRAFDSTGYDGQVVVKSPWTNLSDGPQERDYFTVSVRDLEFLYEEIQSGARSEADSHTLLLSRYRSEGQTTLTSLLRPDQERSLIVRNAAIVTIKSGQNNAASVRTTDGAEWRVSEVDMVRCGVSPGRDVSILVLPEKTPALSVQRGGEPCRLDIAFVSGW